MSKAPEEMAEEWVARNRSYPYHPERSTDKCVKAAFLAGYKAGCEVTDQEIVDVIVDIRKREEEERNKLPPYKEERHARIWEKIKVKMVGIF